MKSDGGCGGPWGRGMRMSLLRCPKFLRCLTADAGNFDRGHSLTSLPLPPAALSSLPTASVRTGFAMTAFLQEMRYGGRTLLSARGRFWGALCGEVRALRPTLYYIMLLCGAWGRGCKRPFARRQGGGAPRPVGGIFASYLFKSSKLSAVTMDWTLVHRGAKVLARSS